MKRKYVDYLYNIYKTSFGSQLVTTDLGPQQEGDVHFAPIVRPPTRGGLTILTPSPEVVPPPAALEEMSSRLKQFLNSTFEMLKRNVYEDIITERLKQSFVALKNKSSDEILYTTYQNKPLYREINRHCGDIHNYNFINSDLASRAAQLKDLIKEGAEFRNRVKNLIRLKTTYN